MFVYHCVALENFKEFYKKKEKKEEVKKYPVRFSVHNKLCY